ncbi:MAG TPA: hypothetical protein VJ843_05950 [Candidatus Saccharimonadales bacterium]|nr:hypothetical protein [Candidatus Saccharimonadales bacterium]
MNPEYPQINNIRVVKRMILVLSAITLAISAWLVVLTQVGYGHLQLSNVPSASVVTVNGHKVAYNSNLKVRPGSYMVVITSSSKTPFEGKANVGLFRATTFKPTLTDRDPNAIVSSIIGANGQYGAPGLSDVKWFDNKSWFAAVVGPGSSTPIAMQFTNGTWQIKYFLGDTYPQDLSVLPTEVSQYIQALEAKYAGL